ncbi:MAG: baseplate J/gp47 family protein [Bacilli bacterium]|nr:baseplate J/gp47 family protein [Bacilli bacterium]
MEISTNYSESVRRLKSNSNIQYFDEGSVAGSIISSTNDVVANQVAEANYEVNNYQIDKATGDALDNIGQHLSIQRRSGKQSSGFISIDINQDYSMNLQQLLNLVLQKTGQNLDSIIIPANTIFTNEDKSKRYALLSDYILSDEIGNEQEIVSIVSTSDENVAANELNTIENPNEVLLVIEEYLRIYNKNIISNGEDLESDSNYQYRLSQYAQLDQAANITAITNRALSVSGVSDIRVTPYKNGCGKVKLVVISENPITTNGLLASVRNSVLDILSASEDIVVESPKYVGIYLKVFLTTTDDATDDEINSAISSIKNEINSYINSLQLGQSLNINEINKIFTDYNIINTYKIESFIKGEYNTEDGSISYPETLALANQNIEDDSQFRTNDNLIMVYC